MGYIANKKAKSIQSALNELYAFVHSDNPLPDSALAAAYGIMIAHEHGVPAYAFLACGRAAEAVAEYLDDADESLDDGAILEHMVEAVLQWEPSVAGPFSAWLYALMSECGAPAASYRSAIFTRLDQQIPV